MAGAGTIACENKQCGKEQADPDPTAGQGMFFHKGSGRNIMVSASPFRSSWTGGGAMMRGGGREGRWRSKRWYDRRGGGWDCGG